MSNQKARLEKIEKILRRIAAESSSGTVIIVEGKNDETALRRLGLTHQSSVSRVPAKGSPTSWVTFKRRE